MIKNIYSMFDKKLERYNQPGFAADDKEIMISISRAMKDKTQFLYLNRDDLAIYCVGSFDDKTGIIEALNVPRLVCDCYSLSED